MCELEVKKLKKKELGPKKWRQWPFKSADDPCRRFSSTILSRDFLIAHMPTSLPIAHFGNYHLNERKKSSLGLVVGQLKKTCGDWAMEIPVRADFFCDFQGEPASLRYRSPSSTDKGRHGITSRGCINDAH